MASSQVEIASSPPFGCVLRDHNRRNGCSRESSVKAAAAFQKNLKELVRDHLHNCISLSSDSSSDENSQNQTNSNIEYQNLRCVTNNQPDNVNSIHYSPTMSNKEARNLDRWAARQAQEMVSTIEKQSREADPYIASSSSKPSTLTRENSPNSVAQSENSSGSQNLGASSLVQIWEARLHGPESRLNKSNSLNNSRTSSDTSSTENASSSPSRNSDVGASATNEELLVDWETTAHSMPSSIHSRNSDAGERERVRIADIIKKLTSDSSDHGQGTSGGDSPSRERRQSTGSDQAEQRGFSQIISSPKIRGRQAFNDLLLQMEQDRHRELNSLAERQAVSRFSQRGRIQSLLRLRFLRRDTVIQDQQRPQSNPRTPASDANQSQKGSNIRNIRERFRAAIEQARTTISGTSTPKSRTKTVSSSVHIGNSSTQYQPTEESHHEGTCTEQRTERHTENTASQKCKVRENSHQTTKQWSEPQVEKFASQTSEVCENSHQGTSTEKQSAMQLENSASQKSKIHENSHRQENSTELQSTKEVQISVSQTYEAHEDRHHQEIIRTEQQSSLQVENCVSHKGKVTEDVREETSASSDVTWQETNLEVENFDPRETLETTPSSNEWYDNEIEGEESYGQRYFEETNYDWFSDIARPRSYWEDLRQAWYQEMLSTSSDNDEIRQLLERRTVSNILTTDFRERMDRLMLSRAQIQVTQEDEELHEDSQERMGRLMLSYFRRHLHAADSQEQEQEQDVDGRGEEVEEEQEVNGRGEEAEAEEFVEEEEEDDDDEGERSPTNHQYIEATGYFSQFSPSMHSPSTFRPWNCADHHEVTHDTEQVPTSPHRPLPSQASNQDRPYSSSTSHPSMEMELIYDLRGHMAQLQREMFELRKSIESLEMQVTLKNSLKQEVHPAQAGQNSLDRLPTRRGCCICYEMQVDSFLYRCGHMCTCLKCAHELQWSSGKCPICRAPILDVVRAYMDS